MLLYCSAAELLQHQKGSMVYSSKSCSGIVVALPFLMRFPTARRPLSELLPRQRLPPCAAATIVAAADFSGINRPLLSVVVMI